jgi:hypothetical protein
MTLPPILLQNPVTLVPEDLSKIKGTRDGVLTLTAQQLSFVQQHRKTAQAAPSILVMIVAAWFFVRASSGSIHIDPTLLTFSWVWAVGMVVYYGRHLYQIFTASDEAFHLDIPLIAIAKLSEERLRFTRNQYVLRVQTHQGKIHRFATSLETADWVNPIGEALQEQNGRTLQFKQDGDFRAWEVRG